MKIKVGFIFFSYIVQAYTSINTHVTTIILHLAVDGHVSYHGKIIIASLVFRINLEKYEHLGLARGEH